MPKKEKIEAMFDGIAPDYDRLNHLMSLSIDTLWRKRALRRLVDREGLRILDLACGTGDFSMAIASRMRKKGFGGTVTGVDLSEGMLAVMAEKVRAKGLQDLITSEKGDGEALRFPDGSFDRVSIAFGIRNFEQRAQGLAEMRRVLTPEGRLVILELSVPENRLIRWFYELYFLHILPWIGGRVSGDKAAYRYLPASVEHFPPRQAFMEELRQAGFRNITHRAMSLGICRMYLAEK